MSSEQNTARVWTEHDIRGLLDGYRHKSRSVLREDKAKYKGLLHQGNLTLEYEHLHLIFGDGKKLEILQDECEWLLGSEWQKIEQNYLKNTPTATKVLSENYTLDLSSVPPEFALSKFNILAQGTGIKIRSFIDDSLEEISAVVNLAIALSMLAARAGRGLFLWQAKQRVDILHKEHWHRVPDILYLDYRWSTGEVKRFLEANYDNQSDFLCADLRLQSRDVVLPFLLDFPGTRQENDEDARVIAYIDAARPPLAAISIPGAAYIGWIRDMIPAQDSPDFADHYLHKTDTHEGYYLLSKEQRERTNAKDTAMMYDMVVNMFDNPIPDALVFYKLVLDLGSTARRSDRQE